MTTSSTPAEIRRRPDRPPSPNTAARHYEAKLRRDAEDTSKRIEEIEFDLSKIKFHRRKGHYKIYIWIAIAIIALLCCGMVYAGYSLSYSGLKRLVFGDRWFTVEELELYDGEHEGYPTYLSIKGHVIDVTRGENYYAVGRGYHHFTGRDATRAFITGCFRSGLTHDLRGLKKEQIKAIDDWVEFYINHDVYRHMGYLKLPPIDPTSDPPNDTCPQK